MPPPAREAARAAPRWGKKINWVVLVDRAPITVWQFDGPLGSDIFPAPRAHRDVHLIAPGTYSLAIQGRVGAWTGDEWSARWKTSTVVHFPAQTFVAGAEYTLELSEDGVVFSQSRRGPGGGAGERVLLREDFDHNARRWPLGTTEARTISIGDGRYKMAVRTAGLTAWTRLGVDPTMDFTIEARLREAHQGWFAMWTEYKPDQTVYHTAMPAHGLAWGQREADGFFAFLIANGSYSIGRVQPGGRPFWDRSPHIRRAGEDNTLTLIKAGDWLEHYINGHLVAVRSFPGVPGPDIGFAVAAPSQTTSGAHEVHVDHLIVKQWPPPIPPDQRQARRAPWQWQEAD
jgi:hypothetical protein